MAHQVRYSNCCFWRHPQSAIFTFAFPVLFVTIIGTLLGGVGKSAYHGGLPAPQYCIATIGAVPVLGSCYGQLAVALAARRAERHPRAARAMLLPACAYFTGLLAHCALMSLDGLALSVRPCRRRRPALRWGPSPE